VAPAAGGRVGEDEFLQLTDMLCPVVQAAPALLDRTWRFLVQALLPAASTLVSEAAQLELHRQVKALPWHRLRCHLADADFVPELLRAIRAHPCTLTAVFAKVDWLAFLTHLVSAHAEAGGGAAGGGPAGGESEPRLSSWLRLLCEVNLAAPQAISNTVRIAAFGDGPGADTLGRELRELHAQVCARAAPRAVASQFDGTVLLGALTRCAADPGERLVENAALLYSVAVRTADPADLAAAASEARSLIYVSLSDKDGRRFWHLPFASHTALVSGVLVPAALALSRAKPTPHDELAVALRALLSAADTDPPPPLAQPGGLPFASRADLPFPPLGRAFSDDHDAAAPTTGWFSRAVSSLRGGAAAEAAARLAPNEAAFSELSGRILSLVTQFCRGASKEASFGVVGLLPTTVVSIAVLCRLMEAALQAYLNNAGVACVSDSTELDFVAEPLATLGAAIASRPALTVSALSRECLAQQARSRPPTRLMLAD
jgi:hypothetical protein